MLKYYSETGQMISSLVKVSGNKKLLLQFKSSIKLNFDV